MVKMDFKEFGRTSLRGVIVLLIILVSLFSVLRERALRAYTQIELTKTSQALEAVEKKLLEKIRDKKAVQDELSLALEKVSNWEREIKEKEQKMQIVLSDLEKEAAARRQAEAMLIVSTEELNRLKTQVSAQQ